MNIIHRITSFFFGVPLAPRISPTEAEQREHEATKRKLEEEKRKETEQREMIRQREENERKLRDMEEACMKAKIEQEEKEEEEARKFERDIARRERDRMAREEVIAKSLDVSRIKAEERKEEIRKITENNVYIIVQSSAEGAVQFITSMLHEKQNKLAAIEKRKRMLQACQESLQWLPVSNIVYGQELSGKELNATVEHNDWTAELALNGYYLYNPGFGSTLDPGYHQLRAEYVILEWPEIETQKFVIYNSIKVEKATPTIIWEETHVITVLTRLTSAIVLNAKSPCNGTFEYDQKEGSLLKCGIHTVSVTFYPTDSFHYATSSASCKVHVEKEQILISWSTPQPITFGMEITERDHLNAAIVHPHVLSIPSFFGVFSYSHNEGDILEVGTHQLSVEFLPSISNDEYYIAGRASVLIHVRKFVPVIKFPRPSCITYGQLQPDIHLTAEVIIPNFPFVQLSSDDLEAILCAKSSKCTQNQARERETAHGMSGAASFISIESRSSSRLLKVSEVSNAILEKNVHTRAFKSNSDVFKWLERDEAEILTNPDPSQCELKEDSFELYSEVKLMEKLAESTSEVQQIRTELFRVEQLLALHRHSKCVNDRSQNVPDQSQPENETADSSNPPTHIRVDNFVGCDKLQDVQVDELKRQLIAVIDKCHSMQLEIQRMKKSVNIPLKEGAHSARSEVHISSLCHKVNDHRYDFYYSDGLFRTTEFIFGCVPRVLSSEVDVEVTNENGIDYDATCASSRVDTGQIASADARDLVDSETLNFDGVWGKFGFEFGESLPSCLTPPTSVRSYSSLIGGVLSYSALPLQSLSHLPAGEHKITAAFCPYDTANVESCVEACTSIVVLKADPVIVWKTPKPIIVGTPLDESHLNAVCTNVSGGFFSYDPSPGTVLAQGTHKIYVYFTPSDEESKNFNFGKFSVDISIRGRPFNKHILERLARPREYSSLRSTK